MTKMTRKRMSVRFPEDMLPDMDSFLRRTRAGGERYTQNEMVVDAMKLFLRLDCAFTDEITKDLPVEFEI